jgi:hypothetical protein
MYKIIVSILFLICFLGFSAHSQQRSDIETLLRSGVQDVNTYLNHYIQPAAEGFAYSMGAGWANTAATHKAWGFDLKVGLSAAAVPGHMESFTFDPAAYSNLRVRGESGHTDLPTVFGNPSSGKTMEIYEQGFVVGTVDALPGAGLPVNYVPAPIIQAGLGLPTGTDLKLRYLPSTTIEGTRVGILGGGIQHDLKQHIPGLRALPFRMSGLVAFNSLKADYALDQIENGRGELSVNTWTYQFLLSKKLSIFTLYGSAGYISGTSDFDLLGTYYPSAELPPVIDPISLSYAVGGAMGNVGVRIDLGPIFINTDYTFQEFNIITAGLGVSIR